jgi:hypothetical protein
MTRVCLATILAASCATLASQTAPPPQHLLSRKYVDGEQARYVMKGHNNANSYEVQITATTVMKAPGRFAEEFAWSNLVTNGTPRTLPASSQAFRIAITLGDEKPFEAPDLSMACGLIGPVTDLMTFYADLFLAMHQGALAKAGDRFVFPSPVAASWADGVRVVLGEDHIDFDLTLVSADAATGIAELLVKHVPPAQPKIRLPANWMRAPVADASNNWVQVEKTATGYEASVGKETFDVTLTVRIADGRLISATMVNPVTAITRTCSDEALTRCSDAKPDPTMRRIEMTLVGGA